MDQNQNLFVIQTVFAGIAAVAIILQAAILFAVYRAVLSMQKAVADAIPKVESLVERADAVLPKVDALVESTKATVDESRKLVESANAQLAKVDEVVTDVISRARIQMNRVEMVLDDTLDTAQQTVNVVSRGVLRPLREIQGLAAGIQAAFGYLARSGRPSVDRATSDEEMFI
jgi:ABC-type transporter Mla subunit MlaD